MITIRIPQNEWGRVWKFLTALGPITRVSTDHIYQISPEHLSALKEAG